MLKSLMVSTIKPNILTRSNRYFNNKAYVYEKLVNNLKNIPNSKLNSTLFTDDINFYYENKLIINNKKDYINIHKLVTQIYKSMKLEKYCISKDIRYSYHDDYIKINYKLKYSFYRDIYMIFNINSYYYQNINGLIFKHKIYLDDLSFPINILILNSNYKNLAYIPQLHNQIKEDIYGNILPEHLQNRTKLNEKNKIFDLENYKKDICEYDYDCDDGLICCNFIFIKKCCNGIYFPSRNTLQLAPVFIENT